MGNVPQAHVFQQLILIGAADDLMAPLRAGV